MQNPYCSCRLTRVCFPTHRVGVTVDQPGRVKRELVVGVEHAVVVVVQVGVVADAVTVGVGLLRRVLREDVALPRANTC